MNNMIHDIFDDPGEYLPVLLLLTALLGIWAGLCWSGFASIRATRRRRRFWFGLAPLVFGFIGVWAQMPFSMESGDGQYHWNFDFRWLFIIPLLLGTVGVAWWWRARREAVA